MAEVPSGNKNEAPVLLSHREDLQIAHIVLNRPRCLNAINRALLDRLVDCLRQVTELSPKVCILSGAGTSFCSGEDLKETLAPKSGGSNAAELRESFNQLQEITRQMTSSDTVYIAAVRGWAVGGGAEIALAADLVVAEPTTVFRFPEIVHGHAPTGGITGRLPQLIGLQRAKHLLLLGEDVTSERALSLGLVTEVASDALARAASLAEQLASRSSRSLGSIKRSVELATFPNAETVLRMEVEMANWCFSDPKAGEAFERFRNRKATESGRSGSVWREHSLISLLVAAAGTHPHKAFLRFGAFDTTYQKFLKDVKVLASGLLEAGVREGDVVCGMMLNSVEMVQLWFASMWIKAIWAPLHTEIRGVTLEHALKVVSPKIMIIDEIFVHILPHTPCSLFVKGGSATAHKSFSSLLVNSERALEVPTIPPTATSSLLFTSGTTGPSKAVELSHQYFVSVGSALIDSLKLNQDDVLFCPFPLCHADATSLTVIPSLILRTTAAISTKFSASKWWDEIRQTKSTIADFMGATLSILFKSPPKADDGDNPLRIMWGVPVPAWVEQFEDRFKLKVYEVYGSTETGLPVVQPIDKPRVKGSCGVALEGVKLRIVDDSGVDVAPGVVGELLVYQRPVERFSRYYKDVDATRKALRDGWFYTGDLCRMDDDGNLFFVGRRKHVIRRRGENISAFEVEEALLRHPDIMECAAYGVPSELTEEDVKVSIVKRVGSSLTEHDVHQFAMDTMSRFQVPRFIEFVDALPRTPTGKLEVFKLQDAWEKGERANVKEFQTPRRTT